MWHILLSYFLYQYRLNMTYNHYHTIRFRNQSDVCMHLLNGDFLRSEAVHVGMVRCSLGSTFFRPYSCSWRRMCYCFRCLDFIVRVFCKKLDVPLHGYITHESDHISRGIRYPTCAYFKRKTKAPDGSCRKADS